MSTEQARWRPAQAEETNWKALESIHHVACYHYHYCSVPFPLPFWTEASHSARRPSFPPPLLLVGPASELEGGRANRAKIIDISGSRARKLVSRGFSLLGAFRFGLVGFGLLCFVATKSFPPIGAPLRSPSPLVYSPPSKLGAKSQFCPNARLA